MQRHRYKLLLLAIFACAADSSAQSTGPSELNASGGSATTGGFTHEFAIGTVVGTPSYASASLVVTPGVLQPASANVKVETIRTEALHVYPSPMESNLYLSPAFSGAGALQYRLFDAAGKLIISRTAALSTGSELQTLDVRDLASGNYMLQVSWTGRDAAEQQTSYKVQKLK